MTLPGLYREVVKVCIHCGNRISAYIPVELPLPDPGQVIWKPGLWLPERIAVWFSCLRGEHWYRYEEISCGQ